MSSEPSPKQVAREVKIKIYQAMQNTDTAHMVDEIIATAISNAVEEEREACAKVADQVVHLPKLEEGEEWSQDAVDAIIHARVQIVQAIRARSKKEVK